MATKKLKSIMAFFGISLAALFGGCNPTPNNNEVVGSWISSDKAKLTFDENGQFLAHAIPRALFFRMDQSGNVDGKGTWKLEKGSPYWEIKLSFKEIDGQSAGFATSVLVAGNGATMYLYQWEGEEGGSRYRFDKEQQKGPSNATKPTEPTPINSSTVNPTAQKISEGKK